MKKGIFIALSLAAITLPGLGKPERKLQPELSVHFDSYLLLINGFGAGFRLPASSNSFIEIDASFFSKAREELDYVRLTSIGVSWLAKANTNPRKHFLLGPGIDLFPSYQHGVFVHFKMGWTMPMTKSLGIQISVYPLQIQPIPWWVLVLPKLQIGIYART